MEELDASLDLSVSQEAEFCVLPQSPVMWEAGPRCVLLHLKHRERRKKYFTYKLSIFDVEAFCLS